MSSDEVRSGRAQLRDMSSAQGMYEVDYTVHVSTRIIKHVDAPSTTRRLVTADIHSINGRKLKNGKYGLEEDGKILFEFEKNGADWYAI